MTGGDLSASGWGGLQVNSAPAYRNTYNYDPTGNRVLTIKDGERTTSTFDAANQNVYSIDAKGRTTYSFDPNGNRTGVEKPDGSRTTTTYDYENRDIRVHLPTGVVNTMAYDPDGLRVLLQDSSGTKKFVYDNQQYLLQTDGGNIVIAIQTQEPGTYSNLISQYQFDGTLWLPSYQHYDNIGDTAELTDSAENVTDTYDYNAWGELLASTGTTPNPFQYRGKWGYFTNPNTGEIYVLMRTYDPATGRWTTLDILRFVDGLNMYLAVFVPNGVDPSGLDAAYWGRSVGATAYWGLRGGVTVDYKVKYVACCTNGIRGEKTVYDGRIHGEIGIGLGLDVRILTAKLSLQFVVSKVTTEIGVTCETECGTPGGEAPCCRTCWDIPGIHIPLPITPISSLSIGFGVGVEVVATISGSFRICYNWAGCKQPGWALGFCGSGSVEASITTGLFGTWGSQADIASGCAALIGTSDMLDW